MKKKDYREFKTKETAELEKALAGKRTDLAKTVPSLRSGKEKNLKKAKNLRREIAQILTLIREKEIVKREASK